MNLLGMFKVFWLSLPMIAGGLLSAKANDSEAINNFEKPNIILIVGDDHGNADLSQLGILSDVSTPNFDRLAKGGIYFSQAYATSPICSPSRMGLITGVYHQRFGTYWYGGDGLHLEKYPTIPELLKPAGYTTGYVGKVHYGRNDSDTTNRNFPLNHGFDFFFGHTSARKHYLVHHDEVETAYSQSRTDHDRKGQSLQMGALWNGTERIDTNAFSTALFGRAARSFMKENQQRPFFLQLAFNAVHNFTHQLPESYLEENNLDGVSDWDPTKEEYYDWYQEARYPNNPIGRDLYLAQLHFLDLEIGLILDEIIKLGLSENTMVIYIGDNGGSTPIYANNTPLRGSKYMLYEGGIRVPLIISFPSRFAQGQKVTNMVSALDILPTICELVSISTPDIYDGQSILPLLDGRDPDLAHEVLYWETSNERAIRKNNLKWHEALDDRSAIYEMVELELGQFLRDLGNDPGEQKDISKSMPDKLKELRGALESWSAEIRKDQK